MKVAKKVKIDTKKIAKTLGADSIASGFKNDSRGREYFEFTIVGDKRIVKRIYKLVPADLARDGYKELADTQGQFLWHCVYMGRHTENFFKRVVGFQIMTPTIKEMKLRVIFYEKA